MKEDFLHHLWQFKKMEMHHLHTSSGEVLRVLQTGNYNSQSGPDFFNARLQIGEQDWAGNVEMHLKSSDWYAHGHQTDPAYDNVILHVVWEHDTEVFDCREQPLPTLVLKNFVSERLMENYQTLLQVKGKNINCENSFAHFDDFLVTHWLERLYVERLEQKTVGIQNWLVETQNDWEAVLFRLMARYFGTKVNADAFESMAVQTPFSVIRKTASEAFALEALLMGQAGLLNENLPGNYFNELKKEHLYLTHKFKIAHQSAFPPQFFRIRPPNFPTLRLSQLAQLYHKNKVLFQELAEAKNLHDIYALFNVKAADFWDTHYHFNSPSKKLSKYLSKGFIDILLINAVFPLLFTYAKLQKGNFELLLQWMAVLTPEKNKYTQIFEPLKPVNKNALCSQALLQLYQNYCAKNQCLHCALGNNLLR